MGFNRNLGLAGLMIGLLAGSSASAVTYQQLYAFQGGSDGASPSAALTDVDGALYGTTAVGGTTDCKTENGCGTVFKVTTSGKETVLHAFPAFDGDGTNPSSSLTNVKGTLYGTTGFGGNHGGTVFKITPAGQESVLYAFSGHDRGIGNGPYGPPIVVKGTLYGATADGGSRACGIGCGAVFSLTLSGHAQQLYAFKGGSDGTFPETGVINDAGTLYGTTFSGGGTGCDGSGCGTVFRVTRGGHERVLYAFQASNDGGLPEAGLIYVNGELYGTTAGWGGGAGCGGQGCGTVFKMTTTGQETVLYTFLGGNDGVNPAASLLNVNGTLYGTTVYGGGTGCFNGDGCGTVFAVSPSGQESVLYAFQGGSDGANPYAALITINGTLYGTTAGGGGTGCNGNGCGTVFAITP